MKNFKRNAAVRRVILLSALTGTVLMTGCFRGSPATPATTLATGIITTVAGDGTQGFRGDGGFATSAELGFVVGVTVDSAGNLYLADSDRIRKVAAATGIITTVAGNGTLGYSGDGGAATSAEITIASGVTVDNAGNLYIVDTNNNRIRKVAAATGIITTVAGNGTQGFSGDGGAATSAELFLPSAVAVDSTGNLYIVDRLNGRIRKVAAATGVITTVASGGFNTVFGVAVDSAGNLYLADTNYNCILKVATGTGVITTVAGNGIPGSSGDAGAATSAELFDPSGVAMDSAGDLYIADSANNLIRKVAAGTGVITTVAGGGTSASLGDGGTATSAELYDPEGVAVDSFGNLYIADTSNNRIRKVTNPQ